MADGEITDQAAEEWHETRRVTPLPGRTYLVATRGVGVVMDVAFFSGPRPDGGLWWVMTNADFPSSAVTHWAVLVEPKSLPA